MASSTEICNLALTMIGQEPVVTLDDTTKGARLCKRWYNPVLEAELRGYPWTFAMKRAVLSPLYDKGLAEFPPVPELSKSYVFQLPTDCIRIANLNVPYDQYTLEGNKIYADTDTLYIRYVSKPESSALFDPQFVMVLACAIAIELCIPLTDDQDLLTKLLSRKEQLVSHARNTQSIEASPQPVVEGEWIPSRF